MPRHCILGCPEGILFSFPKRPLLRRRWLKFLQMKEAAISASSRMCHQHFSPQCFSNLRQVEMGLAKYPSLKEDAVPTLHPDDSQVSEDDISETENELDGMTEAADLSVSHKYETRSANRNRYCSTGVQTFSDYASVGTQTQKMVFNNNITPTKTNPNETKEESLQLFVRGDAEKFVVCRSNLLSLFLACPFCCAKTTAKVQQQVETYIRIQQICESCGRERMWENQDDPHKNVFTSNDGHGVAQSANESQDWCLHGSYPQVEAAAQMDTMVIKVEVEEVGVDSLRTKCDSSLKAERIMKEEGEFNSTADDMEDLLIEVKDEPGNVLEENMNTNLDTRETYQMSAKRKSYSVEYKKGIVEDSQGKNLTAFCKEKKLDLRMVRKWRAEYENISQLVDEGNAKKRKCGSGRQPSFPVLEDVICEWIADRRAKSLLVRRADIQSFALAMAPQIEISSEEFKASQHWLDGFLQRYELSL